MPGRRRSTTTCRSATDGGSRRCPRWPPSGGCSPGEASSSPSPPSAPAAPGGGSRRSCPTSAGRPTPPTGPSPMAPTSRSSTSLRPLKAPGRLQGLRDDQGRQYGRHTFHEAAGQHGSPASLLTDNGAIFTAESRHGRCAMENELARLGIAYKHSRPYHPQTCGQGRTVPPDAQEAPGPQAQPGHPGRAPEPARPVPELLQHRPAPSGHRAAHASGGLRRPDQGHAEEPAGHRRGPSPGPP